MNEKQRKAVALASVLASFSSLSLVSTSSRHLFKLGSERVFGVEAHTLGYWVMALGIIGLAFGIGMLVKLVHDARQDD
jgi:hypothetical protein